MLSAKCDVRKSFMLVLLVPILAVLQFQVDRKLNDRMETGRGWKEIEGKSQEDILFQDFLSWLDGHGAIRDKIRFVDFDNFGRGALAIKTIPSDEEICSIPTHLLISGKVVKESEFGRKVMEQYEALEKLEEDAIEEGEKFKLSDEWTLTYFFILLEKSKGKDSHWGPYLSILPHHIGTPLTFTQGELNILKGSNLYSGTLALKTSVRKSYDRFLPLVKASVPSGFNFDEVFGFDRFMWAYQIFWSRSLSILLDGQRIGVLAPLIDMLNHHPKMKVSFFTDEIKKRFRIDAHHEIAEGTQAFINYGNRPNEKLLLYYGFIIPNNDIDWYFVRIGIQNENENENENSDENENCDEMDEVEKQEKRERTQLQLLSLKRMKLSFDHYFLMDKVPIVPRMKMTLRILCANEEELYLWEGRGNFAEDSKDKDSNLASDSRPGSYASDSVEDVPLSNRNEWLMLSTLESLLKGTAAKFPRNLQDNEEDLELALKNRRNFSENSIHAMYYVVGQQRILRDSLNYLKEMQRKFHEKFLALFQMPQLEKIIPLKGNDWLLYKMWFSANSSTEALSWEFSQDLDRPVICVTGCHENDLLGIFPENSVIIPQNLDLGNLVDGISEVSEGGLVTLYLIREKFQESSSQKSPFFKVLQPIPHVIFLEKEDVDLLFGNSYVAQNIYDLIDENFAEFQEIMEKLKENGNFNPEIHTWENWRWGNSVWTLRIELDDPEISCIQLEFQFST
eukprot:TRINITY_DN5492_c0_g1_i1.p1 TRINITY_DN5492_c0_g1~~TRINITY_DN5492_c0_g1_i1.p1  ORF type:complete len:734 (-),score=255.62 TRINITY_DN5492_c0_g1_i1:710-2911(-)